jgi:hypothetical protein
MAARTALNNILRGSPSGASAPQGSHLTGERNCVHPGDDVEHVVAGPGIHVFAELEQGSHNDFFACVCVGSGRRHIWQQIRTIRERTG